MQDRYFGDIGDFAKYGLLRAVTTGEPPLRLAVLWYLVPDESHNDDGRHVDYLEPTTANLARFRDCDPELFDKLGDLVRTGTRSVSAVPEHALLPSGTVYHDAPLDYSRVPREDRAALRERWLTGALDTADGADVVFLDPDNGLEVGCSPCDDLGPKYTYYDDVSRIPPAKTLVVYQHSARTPGVPFLKQLETRMEDLRSCLHRPQDAFFAMRWRRVSARAYIFATASSHRTTIRRRLEAMLAGPWGEHFELVEARPDGAASPDKGNAGSRPSAAPVLVRDGDAGAETFHGGPGSAAELAFTRWRRENPDGFYVNCRSAGNMMLHRQSCSGLDFDGSMCLTAAKKVCSSDRRPLETWAAKHGSRPLRICKRCRPRT